MGKHIRTLRKYKQKENNERREYIFRLKKINAGSDNGRHKKIH